MGAWRSRIGLAVALAIAGCTAHVSFTIGVTTPVVYVEPPQARSERVVQRAGYFWMPGHWDWEGNRWIWRVGQLQPDRVGYTWEAGAWVRRGNAWHWIEGHWTNAGDDRTAAIVHVETEGTQTAPVAETRVALYPTAAPPLPRTEEQGAPRDGQVFIGGRWDWREGRWTWLDGHWEAERDAMMWNPGRWQLQGSYYVWIEGSWGASRFVRERRR